VAALTHLSNVATQLSHAVQNLGVGPGGPAGGRRLAREEQLGRYAAEQSKSYRLYLYSGKVTLAVMYLRRVGVVSRSSAAAVTLAVILPGEGTHAGTQSRRQITEISVESGSEVP